MRITRLQLLIVLVLVGGIGISGLLWWRGRITTTARKSSPVTPVSSAVPIAKNQLPSISLQASAKTIAIVGEAYRKLAKESGDIPSVSVPLRTAKAAQAAGDYPKAMDFAKEAWLALKIQQKTADRGVYTVAKGDTLWGIAEKHSPVRQGPGWVAIWKANKRLIKDFDWIEVGWALHIPMKRSAYVMAYWKPRPPAESQNVFTVGPGGTEEIENPGSCPAARAADANPRLSGGGFIEISVVIRFTTCSIPLEEGETDVVIKLFTLLIRCHWHSTRPDGTGNLRLTAAPE
ncbi:MAG: LysM peptidoglycan-binding domain-containing protein [Elusimicrobiota bacterium]